MIRYLQIVSGPNLGNFRRGCKSSQLSDYHTPSLVKFMKVTHFAKPLLVDKGFFISNGPVIFQIRAFYTQIRASHI